MVDELPGGDVGKAGVAMLEGAEIEWFDNPNDLLLESATCDKAEEIDILIIGSTESVLVNTIQL